ncbi:MAG: leishmanolysin-related zinc metalloendopeptidase [Gemmatimonadales bacterium]
MRRIPSWRPAAALACLAALASCRSDSSNIAGEPSRITVVAGVGQQAAVGTGVTVAPTVQVVDGAGAPIRGKIIRFSIASGGGTVLGDSTVTDASGRATVGEWIMGTVPGTNTLRASLDSTALAATVSATAVPGDPVAVRVSGQASFVALVNQAIQPLPAVLVIDSYSNPVPGVAVTFTVLQGNGSITGGMSTTNGAGIAQIGSWIAGASSGVNQLSARISSGASLTFSAQALTAAPNLTAASPVLQQDGFLNFQVTQIPRVRVTDGNGNILVGVPVTFSNIAGDGVVTGPQGISDSRGLASPTDWRLGATGSSTMAASTPLGTAPVDFTASGSAAPFRIDLRFISTPSADVRDAFVAAARRWMGIITAHLGAVAVDLPSGACISGQPAINESVEDVIIFADVEPIDGPGGILGAAGPCAVRSSGTLTAVGSMHFDSADLQSLLDNSQLVATVTHEMAHVLGFGTSWQAMTSGLGGSDPLFLGPQTLSVWPAVAASLGLSAGGGVPLEECGGAGTRDSHWRERTTCGSLTSDFGAELMTGYIEPPGVFMPLSRVTLAAIADLGYSVNLDAADPFAENLLAAPNMTRQPTPINEQLLSARWQLSRFGAARRIR